jgi:hypothetical protein
MRKEAQNYTLSRSHRQTMRRMSADTQHGSVTCGPPGCITRPVTAFANCLYTIKISQQFRQAGTPLVSFPRAARDPADNNGCGS